MGIRLFVGNLPYSCNEEELKRLFEPRWGVIEARIVLDRETGRSRGFGFVELAEGVNVQEVIQGLDGKEVAGRPLAVREAHDRAPKPRGPRPGRPDVPVEQAPRRSFPRDDRPPPREGGGGGGGGGGAGPPPWEAGNTEWANRKGPPRRANAGKRFETDRDEESADSKKGGGGARDKKKRDRFEPDW
ncbi:MAG: RNA-binding protein [Sandaracinaceae bacterium]|nr:RNA-binding protein [Sandaracinaceae bacterium]